MALLAIAALASCLPQAAAFWRMPCGSRLLDARADPIIFPGVVSPHVHTITGGNGFGFTMDYNQARQSTCSTCPITADLSAYWTPKLYYQGKDGNFTMVPQAGDYGGNLGGTTVYYLQRGGPDNDKLKAFPAGFRMVAGNPFKRSSTNDFASDAISFVCLDYSGVNGGETKYLPTRKCPNGVRAQVFFPSCWDGKNLDSPDHTSHVSYPATGAYNSGRCPSTHPVHLISIFFETIYDTANFEWWNGDKQPFVFAQGDPTGYGYHGDFVNGWDVDVLQQAVDDCTNNSGNMQDCPHFKFFTGSQQQSCKVPNVLGGDIQGPMNKLPGCNKVTYGPGNAPIPTKCKRIPKIAYPKGRYTDVTSSGWKYLGCGSDNVASRTFKGATSFTDTMTVQNCIAFCKGKGFQYAGIEYASQCFCDNTLPPANAPVAGQDSNCDMKCKGNDNQYCGGPDALSIYQACNGGSCTNAPGVTSIPGGLPKRQGSRRSVSTRHLDSDDEDEE